MFIRVGCNLIKCCLRFKRLLYCAFYWNKSTPPIGQSSSRWLSIHSLRCRVGLVQTAEMQAFGYCKLWRLSVQFVPYPNNNNLSSWDHERQQAVQFLSIYSLFSIVFWELVGAKVMNFHWIYQALQIDLSDMLPTSPHSNQSSNDFLNI